MTTFKEIIIFGFLIFPALCWPLLNAKKKGGLLDISTARYFYKVFKTILHKPIVNSGINIFVTNVYINIIYNFYNKAYSVKQTVFIKQELFF